MGQQAVAEAGDDRQPALAHEPQLTRDGIGHRTRRCPRSISIKRLTIRPERRLVAKWAISAGDDVRIGVRWISDASSKSSSNGSKPGWRCDPEHEQLFEGDLAVRDAVRRRPRDGRRLAVPSRLPPRSGKRSANASSVRSGRRPADALGDGREGRRDRCGFTWSRYSATSRVEDLVEQAHRVELRRRGRPAGSPARPRLVHPLREAPARREVGQHDVAGQREQPSVDVRIAPAPPARCGTRRS